MRFSYYSSDLQTLCGGKCFCTAVLATVWCMFTNANSNNTRRRVKFMSVVYIKNLRKRFKFDSSFCSSGYPRCQNDRWIVYLHVSTTRSAVFFFSPADCCWQCCFLNFLNRIYEMARVLASDSLIPHHCQLWFPKDGVKFKD